MYFVNFYILKVSMRISRVKYLVSYWGFIYVICWRLACWKACTETTIRCDGGQRNKQKSYFSYNTSSFSVFYFLFYLLWWKL